MKKWLTGKQIAASIGVAAAIIGIIAGGIAIAQFFQHHIDRFEGNVTRQATADSFISFIKDHDAKVIWLNITCAGTTTCYVPGETQEIILPIQASSGKYWFHINTAGTDAQANNGSYGAGALVLKGYFEVSVQGVLGSEPQDVQNIFLKGIDSSNARGQSVEEKDLTIVDEPSYLVIYLETGEYKDPDAGTTIENLGKRLCREIQRANLSFSPLPVPNFKGALSPFTDFLESVLDTDPDCKILFILDEFDEIPKDLYRRSSIGDAFFLTIRSISGKPSFGFILVGSEKMEYLLSNQGEKLNKFEPVRIDYFDREDGGPIRFTCTFRAKLWLIW